MSWFNVAVRNLSSDTVDEWLLGCAEPLERLRPPYRDALSVRNHDAMWRCIRSAERIIDSEWERTQPKKPALKIVVEEEPCGCITTTASTWLPGLDEWTRTAASEYLNGQRAKSSTTERAFDHLRSRGVSEDRIGQLREMARHNRRRVLADGTEHAR